MTYQENSPKFPGIYLIILLVIFAILVGGCKSKKKLVEKKEETVSVLQQNDIKTSDKIKTDVKTISISNSQNISITPVDSQKSSKVIYKGDTLSFLNSKVVIENNSSSETKEDHSKRQTSSSDKSSKNSQSHTREKTTDIQKTGTHPALIWGGLLLLLIIVAVWYFKKHIPFL